VILNVLHLSIWFDRVTYHTTYTKGCGKRRKVRLWYCRRSNFFALHRFSSNSYLGACSPLLDSVCFTQTKVLRLSKSSLLPYWSNCSLPSVTSLLLSPMRYCIHLQKNNFVRIANNIFTWKELPDSIDCSQRILCTKKKCKLEQ
jgi:hypothetical protein